MAAVPVALAPVRRVAAERLSAHDELRRDYVVGKAGVIRTVPVA